MVISTEVFDVGNVSSSRNTTVRVRGNCRFRQLRNNSRNRAYVKAEGTRDICRIWLTIRVVWSSPAMFLTSATCHLFEKRWHESVITAVVVCSGACRHHLHFEISRKIYNFARSIRRLSCVAASLRISHFALYQHLPPIQPVVDTCSRRRQAI